MINPTIIKMTSRIAIYLMVALLWPFACFAQVTDTAAFSMKFTVSEAPEWTALFHRSNGWLGADGLFSIPFDGVDVKTSAKDSAMLIFSDTMIGDIVNGKLNSDAPGVHNSIAVIKNRTPKEENINFAWKIKDNGKPGSFFIPNTPRAEKGDFYWLGDGFFNPETKHTYIFGYRVHMTGSGVFDFSVTGNALIALPKGSRPPFTDQRQMDTPFFIPAPAGNKIGYFGAGILANTKAAKTPHPDGYVYVYGIQGTEKYVLAVRVLPKDFEKIAEWRFWDGKSWNADIKTAVPVADHASDELSVTPLADGRYVMVFQMDGIGSTIGLRVGKSPAGPFGPIIKVWDCKSVLLTKGFYPYNAKAHPALSQPGELLISFNVNSFDWNTDIQKYPNLYHPRFIRIKFN
ncbi:MAG: DUF4185 domain-containing protein [Sphingobacteriaceae bacterium]|nr:MAG: DUF4185 domain-containing protein [Sphingobacteriaceae bacterium]